MQFIALFQAPQNFHAQLKRRLQDRHLLEAPMQGRIFFHRAAVVLRRGGRNAAQVTTGQRWLEQAPSIGTGTIAAHNGVQFIDKQHHPRIRIADLRQHRPQPLLKLPPELGTGDEGPHIKSH